MAIRAHILSRTRIACALALSLLAHAEARGLDDSFAVVAEMLSNARNA